jgi:hypothetical protein
MQNIQEIPTFGIGETCGVREYVERAMPELCARLQVSPKRANELLRLALSSVDASIPAIGANLTAGMVESTTQARAFWNEIGDEMVSYESRLHGLENLIEALALMEKGKNILLIQNHRSGADTMVMEVQRGTASLTVGRPIAWEEIQPGVHLDGTEYQTCMVHTMLGLVAALAPDDNEKGCYAAPEMQALIAHLVSDGVYA